MEVLVLLISIGAALSYVAAPFFRPNRSYRTLTRTRSVSLDLLEQRDSMLSAIKDLELDREIGKVTENDYSILNKKLRRDAVAVLQKIDILDGKRKSRRKLESELNRLRKNGDAHGAIYCRQCGELAKPMARFCKRCGGRLLDGPEPGKSGGES